MSTLLNEETAIDRIFDEATINDICDTCRDAINETKDIIAKIQGTCKGIEGISIPEGCTDLGLKNSARNVRKTLDDQDSYDKALKALDRCQNEMLPNIKEADKKLASQMKEVTDATNAVIGVIDSLNNFMLENPLDMDPKEFQKVLDQNAVKWTKTLDDTSETLEKVINSVKGEVTKSIEYSYDPVNLATGNLIYDKDDLKITSDKPFNFRRFYNSKGTYIGALGKNFIHNYEVHLTIDSVKAAKNNHAPVNESGTNDSSTNKDKADKITLTFEDGREEVFVYVSDSNWPHRR